MSFTALHRALGIAPGPLTSEMVDRAVEAGVRETDDLDWKSALPPAKRLPETEFPKDVAAMANSSGGLIVYGVCESQKAASERVDVGELDEGHERSLRSAAITAISPPIFGLEVHRLETNGVRAVAVEIPASVDGPHLIYRNDYFGAPVRNEADTVWMKERQIEAMYRARFDEQRRSTESLDTLYGEASSGRDINARAWLIAVAHPRIPRVLDRLSRDDARAMLTQADDLALSYASRAGIHPLESVDRLNPRPGLRRWVAVNTATSERSSWRESWISMHHDGSATLATAIGAHRSGRDQYAEGWRIAASAVECAIADFMAVVRTTSAAAGSTKYDVRVSIEWAGEHPLAIQTTDDFGYDYDDTSMPLHVYSAVETTVDASVSPVEYFRQVADLALDCINQGGVHGLRIIRLPNSD